tara:strand:- start:3079 stop:4116 length:1038 start_codon:yes stop_codon:yes gene_type:complete
MSEVLESSVSSLELNAWRKLNNESIFITGATGFFGVALLHSLRRAKKSGDLNIKVTILTRDVAAFSKNHSILLDNDSIDFIQGDIVDFEFSDRQYTKIFHLAGTSAYETFKGEDQLNKYKVYSLGTERILNFASKCGANKVLFSSSGVVYGPNSINIQKITENYLGAPLTIDSSSSLGHGKRTAEFLCSYYSQRYKFKYVIARCFSFVGRHLPFDLHYAIGNFIRDALWREQIVVMGDGTAMRSYLYINDLVIWLLTLMAEECRHNIYNVGSDQAISIRDLAYLVRDLIAPNKEVIVQGNANSNIGNFKRNWYVPCIDRVKDEFKLDVITDLKKAIKLSSKQVTN